MYFFCTLHKQAFGVFTRYPWFFNFFLGKGVPLVHCEKILLRIKYILDIFEYVVLL